MLLLVLVLASSLVASCPSGAVERERTTPEAREQWCELADGTREGPRRAWYPNGKPWFEGGYRAGKRDGAWRFWFESGAVMSSGAYRDDRAQGPFVRWHEGGAKALEGHCKNGLEDGPWARYWPNGKPELSTMWKDGELVGDPSYSSRRGQPVELTRWLADKAGAGADGARLAKVKAENRPEVVFVECRS